MKIVIIGAGPAGLSSAIFLSQLGIDVTLYEAFNVGENIICAEGFFDFHGNIDVFLPDAMKIEKIIFKDMDEIVVTLPNYSKFFTFNRTEWQKGLMDIAISHGTKVVEGRKIKKDEVLELSKKSDYVIDASGIKAVSHFLFPKSEVVNYREGLVPTYQYTLTGNFTKYQRVIKAIVLNNPPGYFWLFPKLIDNKIIQANAGLGFLIKNKSLPNLKTLLNDIIKSEGLDANQILTKKSSPIPTKRLKSYRQDNIILAGDALGLCSPLHGGGIDSAYLSGYYIAKSIINNDFKIYQDFLKSLDNRFTKERIIVYLWEVFGSHRILSRLKKKGLFENSPNNILFSNTWLKKALLSLIF